MTGSRNPCVALALGSGAARGWAHIGVIRALAEAGIEPDIVCGTSIGALVGSAYVSGNLDGLERWIRGLSHLDVLALLDPGFSEGGFIHGAKLMSAFSKHVADRDIGELPLQFAAVATDIESGHEVWLKTGSLLTAVRASIAIPGMFAPVCVNDRWLVDGGLVNPVPVSVARAMDADFVIAVNVNERVGAPGARRRYALPGESSGSDNGFWQRVRVWWAERKLKPAAVEMLFSGASGDSPEQPGILSVMADAVNIMQSRITRARLAGEPADALLSPRVGHIGILELERAAEAIDEGRRCVERALPEIRQSLGTNSRSTKSS